MKQLQCRKERDCFIFTLREKDYLNLPSLRLFAELPQAETLTIDIPYQSQLNAVNKTYIFEVISYLGAAYS